MSVFLRFFNSNEFFDGLLSTSLDRLPTWDFARDHIDNLFEHLHSQLENRVNAHVSYIPSIQADPPRRLDGEQLEDFKHRSHVYFHNFFLAVCFDIEEVVQSSEKVHLLSEVDRLNSILTIIGYILDPSTILCQFNLDEVESEKTSEELPILSNIVNAGSSSVDDYEKKLEMEQLNRFIAVINRLQSSA